jgi:hypothetical protein
MILSIKISIPIILENILAIFHPQQMTTLLLSFIRCDNMFNLHFYLILESMKIKVKFL